jgi:hypothetical protein
MQVVIVKCRNGKKERCKADGGSKLGLSSRYVKEEKKKK